MRRKELILSIIIPIYGVERYLKRCLDCLVNQESSDSLRDKIEIILVDDGSADKSPQICDEYVSKNNIFKVIHKINGGLASARNEGLETAQGKWITFIDPDDMVRKDYLSCVIEAIEKFSEVDCILFGTAIEDDKDKKIYYYDNPSFLGDIADWIRIVEKRGLLNYAWNKIYKRKIIEEYPSVRFAKGKEPGEDLIFNCTYLERCKKAAMLEKHLYIYYKQIDAEESLSHKYWPDLNEKTQIFITSRNHMYQSIGMNLKEDKEELAKQNLYYVYKCIPNMYKPGKQFARIDRITFFKNILKDEQIEKWMKLYPNKEKVIFVFKILYKTKSSFLCDAIYSFLFKTRDIRMKRG